MAFALKNWWSTVDYKGTTNANPVNIFKQNGISFLTERAISSRKPKDDRTYGERVDDRLEVDTGELKRFERRSQDEVELIGKINSWGRYHQGES